MVNWVCADLLGLYTSDLRVRPLMARDGVPEHSIPPTLTIRPSPIALLSHYLRIAISLFIYLRPLPDVLYLCSILDLTTYSTIDAHMLVLGTSNVGSYRRRPRIRAFFYRWMRGSVLCESRPIATFCVNVAADSDDRTTEGPSL